MIKMDKKEYRQVSGLKALSFMADGGRAYTPSELDLLECTIDREGKLFVKAVGSNEYRHVDEMPNVPYFADINNFYIKRADEDTTGAEMPSDGQSIQEQYKEIGERKKAAQRPIYGVSKIETDYYVKTGGNDEYTSGEIQLKFELISAGENNEFFSDHLYDLTKRIKKVVEGGAYE